MISRISIYFFAAIIFISGIFWWASFSHAPKTASNNNISAKQAPVQNKSVQNNLQAPSNPAQKNITQSQTGFVPPLPDAGARVTKKPFGIYITPATSPVQPERFRGYHTGADFEVFPAELDAVVPVSAICGGKLLMKEYASGYGGVAVEGCTLEGNPVTVVYGHLKLSSITAKVGDKLLAGEKLGILGKNKSAETDGERKHLHLGIHKGTSVNILGYVQNKNSLSAWIDPCLYVCGK